MSYWTRWGLGKADPRQFTNGPGAEQSRQQEEFVNSLQDDPNKPGYKASPIPVYQGSIGAVDRTKYSVQNVNVHDLKTRQPYINADKVRRFDRTKLPPGDQAHPLVIKTRDNQLVVDNGNHRVAHMHAIGMKTTKARVIHEIHGYGDQGEGSLP